MTEEEAKTKWCPFARGTIQDGTSGQLISANRGMIEPGCLGSECMAWRELPIVSLKRAREELAADRKISAIKALREARPEVNLKEAKEIIDGERPWPSEEAHGYCGLAGAPQ